MKKDYLINHASTFSFLVLGALAFLLFIFIGSSVVISPEIQKRENSRDEDQKATLATKEKESNESNDSIDSPQEKKEPTTYAYEERPSEEMTPLHLEYLKAREQALWPEISRPSPVNGDPVLYPKLVPICACESSYAGAWWGEPRQYFSNGNVVMNFEGNDDVGMCQINLTENAKKANILGYDLYTRAGNISYANWLFERQGSAPWFRSNHCWRKAFQTDSDLIPSLRR